MAQTQSTSSHRRLAIVVGAIAAVIILVLLSAFVWPRWAVKSSDGASSSPSQSQTSAAATPTISATALPTDATTLLKTMPDSVLSFARVKASAATDWSSATPIEEYTVVYSTGDTAKDVTLKVAQWSTADSAKKQYDALAATLTGQELGSGNVKVSGSTTGTYVVKSDAADAKKAVALWQNGTVVLQASGEKAAVQEFYKQFPL
ncbi:MAG: hypothetical protein ABF453_01700 [Bifidobacterium psychraerophilum]|uniref:hypothetical protein n=1 Tax=Bifidobacterium psychraerophilum TaxID=218140 RepID=UPI00333F4FD6